MDTGLYSLHSLQPASRRWLQLWLLTWLVMLGVQPATGCCISLPESGPPVHAAAADHGHHDDRDNHCSMEEDGDCHAAIITRGNLEVHQVDRPGFGIQIAAPALPAICEARLLLHRIYPAHPPPYLMTRRLRI